MAKTVAPMLDAALEYADAGLPVIPLHSILEDGSCTCGLARCPSPGKHPRTRNGLKDATTDPKTISKWWSPNRWPNASIGGCGGDFLCLDIDAKAGGLETLGRLVEANTALPETAVVATGEYEGERGLHYWYRVPTDVNAATRTAVRQGIDIRCTGGYAVLPPSPHQSGVRYEWITDLTIADAEECPEWVLDLVPEYVEGDSTWTPDPSFKMSKQVKQFLAGDLEVEVGEQRDFLVAAARSVLTTGRPVELAASLLWEGYDGTGGINNSDWGDQPWTPEDVYQIVSDIFAKPPTSPLEKDFQDADFGLHDIGNAKRLLASFKKDHVHYVPESGQWLIWNEAEGQFGIESQDYLHRRHVQMMDELQGAALQVRFEGEAKALYNWAKTSQSRQRVEAAAIMARDWEIVHEYELDADPTLLSVQNGVVNLRTGKLQDTSPSDLLTKVSPAEYDPDCTSTLWEEFLERVVPDPAVRDFLQLACGYSLTGSIEEHKFFYIYGRPATGKSTFLDTFTKVMGTYGRIADTTTFTRGQSNKGTTEDLARLAGARLVVTHEVEENERLASALVAQYTGGDRVAARFLYGRTFEFHPRFKLWIAANHRAKVSGMRSGIWRRMMVIPMDQVVPKDERDPTLPGKLREPEALTAVLAWAVQGAIKWFKINKKGHEIRIPKAVEQEGETYQKESDHLFAFVDEVIEITKDKDDRIPKDELFEIYLAWCDKEGRDRRVTSNVLSRRLRDMDLQHRSMHYEGRSRSCWFGIAVKGSGIKLPSQ